MAQISNRTNVQQLIATAATGAAMVSDIETPLSPLTMEPNLTSTPTPTQTQTPKLLSWSSRTRPERNLWQKDEMLQMLSIMQEMKALDLLSDKSVRSELVFLDVKKVMNQRGYRKKSHMQIWNKWKFLKSTYNISRRNGVMPKTVPPEIYKRLGEILDGYVEHSPATNPNSCDNSKQSSSFAEYEPAASANPLNGNASNGDLHKSYQYDDECSSMGIEHPIFGFRLGMVKTELIEKDDADDYEPPSKRMYESNSENELQEQPQDVDLSYYHQSFKLEQPQHQYVNGNGSLTYNTFNGQKLNRKNGSINSKSATTTSMNASAPQLRVASFAKEIASAGPPLPAHTTAAQVSAPPPPPPLSLSLNGRTRLALQNNARNYGLSLMPPTHTPNGAGLEPCSYATSQEELCNYLQLQRGMVNMSQTPPAPKPPSQKKLQNGAATSSSSYANNNMSTADGPTTSRKAARERERANTFKPRASRFNFEQPATEPKPETSGGRQAGSDPTFESVVGEMSDILRDAQIEMMTAFFEEQKRIAQRDFEFQLRQDALVMQAFRRQTEQLLGLSKELLGVELTLNGDFEMPNFVPQYEEPQAAEKPVFGQRNGKRQRQD